MVRSLVFCAAIFLSACNPIVVPSGGVPALPRTATFDPGGSITDRQAEIAGIELSGIRKEIHGQCYSSCTMFLKPGLACVHEDSSFGFHGPSWIADAPMRLHAFEKWSRVMASYYPETVSIWFMNVARHRQRMYVITGPELVQYGWAVAC